VKRRDAALVTAAGLVYLFFALSCFRLAAMHDYERAVSTGEGLFTLVGASAFFAAALWSRWRAAIVLLGTLPLVAWFAATPWNSGPPFLIASLVPPALASAALLWPLRLRIRPS
jgi:hypothetical protein